MRKWLLFGIIIFLVAFNCWLAYEVLQKMADSVQADAAADDDAPPLANAISLNQLSLNQGQVMDVSYPLGSNYAAVIANWGAPIKKATVEDREGYYYDQCKCAFIVNHADTITGIKKFTNVTIQNVIDALGAPSYEGWNKEMGSYELSYEFPGKKRLDVNVDDPDQTGFPAKAKIDKTIKITDIELSQK